MIDTVQKDGRTLFDHCQEEELGNWIVECRRAGLHAALAGSLGANDAPAIRRLQPDIVGFRGAACRGDRSSGQVDEVLVTNLREKLFV
ncbi:MAG: (5-formylfuran-3-yl)methyl phosphate synthase, partial [Candidatus Promineifilaceae bacterium]